MMWWKVAAWVFFSPLIALALMAVGAGLIMLGQVAFSSFAGFFIVWAALAASAGFMWLMARGGL